MKFKQALHEYTKIEIGDTVLIGKFKNKRAEVKEFGTDKNNQPTVKTNKGERKVYGFRVDKLMPKKKEKKEK